MARTEGQKNAPLPAGFKAQMGKGRPKGKLDRKTEEYLAFGQSVLESEEWKTSARQRMLDGDADHLEQYFAQRIHGKPKEKIEVEAKVPLFALPVTAYVAVTSDEDDGDE